MNRNYILGDIEAAQPSVSPRTWVDADEAELPGTVDREWTEYARYIR
jgi:hypothetical protein